MRIHVQNMHLPQLVARYEGVMAALMSIGTVTELNTVSWNICGWLVWTEKGGLTCSVKISLGLLLPTAD